MDGDLDHLCLAASAEPRVVFTSLAARCVPDLCDSCRVDIVDSDGGNYSIVNPPGPTGLDRPPESAAATPDHVLRMSFALPESGDDIAQAGADETAAVTFTGSATFVWHRRPATRTDRLLATVLVEHAVRTVAWHRSEQLARAATATAENLQTALESSRSIGAAIGIVMVAHKITEDRAFDLLRRASQRTHRKLRDLALDVIETGWLDPALGADAPGRSRP